MSSLRFPDVYIQDYLGNLNRAGNVRKPVIAAVNGFAVNLSLFVLILSLVVDVN